MAKTIFEEMGGTYIRVGDYFLPDLKLPETETQSIGIWGQWHKRYLKEHKRLFYSNLLTSGKLNSYLADIDEQAQDMLFRLVEQMAEKQGVTEALKAIEPMAWIGRMNNIQASAREIVYAELIFA